jgi:hypothetical protein
VIGCDSWSKRMAQFGLLQSPAMYPHSEIFYRVRIVARPRTICDQLFDAMRTNEGAHYSDLLSVTQISRCSCRLGDLPGSSALLKKTTRSR